jgi:hypothetical protein
MCIDQQSKKKQVSMLQRKEYRQILIELMCIDQQSKKNKYLCYKERNTDRF